MLAANHMLRLYGNTISKGRLLIQGSSSIMVKSQLHKKSNMGYIKPINLHTFNNHYPQFISTSTKFSSYLQINKQFLNSRNFMRRQTQPFSSVSNIPPPKRKGKIGGKSPVTWKTLGITAVLVGGALAFVYYLKDKKNRAMEVERKRNLGKAKIGGSFDLIDHNGNPRKSEEFLGQWFLLYFGFTHCPDICPDELEKMATVVDNIDKSKKLPNGIQALFITVDPLRDSVEAVKKYVSEFHPKLIGLTGSVEKIAEACKSYRVYFSLGPKDQDEDYIVDHTIIIYLVDPDGNFVDYYGLTSDATQITDSIIINILKFDKAQNSSIFSALKS